MNKRNKNKYVFLATGIVVFLLFFVTSNISLAADDVLCSCYCDGTTFASGCTANESECSSGCDESKAAACQNGIVTSYAKSCSSDQKCDWEDGGVAQCVNEKTGAVEAPPTNLEVSIGTENVANGLGDYIRIVYDFGVIIVAIVAVVMVVMGGFKWATSGGNSTQIASAKNTIIGALIGLVLALTSWLLLFTINPALVNLERLSIPAIKMATGIDDCLRIYFESNKGPVKECFEPAEGERVDYGEMCEYTNAVGTLSRCVMGDPAMKCWLAKFTAFSSGAKGLKVPDLYCEVIETMDQGGDACVCRFEEDPEYLHDAKGFGKRPKDFECETDWECKSANCDDIKARSIGRIIFTYGFCK